MFIRGGLYLVNIIAIFASTSNNVIARESIYDFRSELNQISWESDCSQREDEIRNYKYKQTYNDDYKHSWILDKYYEKSRTRVIGKAIGDCVANKNEFADKSYNDIITFDEKTLQKEYKPENWNAVILYNYVHEAINGDNFPEDSNSYNKDILNVKEVLGNKLDKIKAYYEHYYQKHIKNNAKKLGHLLDSLKGNLNNAVNDIQKYVDALKLNEYLLVFRQCKLDDTLAPFLTLKNCDVGEGAEFFGRIVLTDEEDKNESNESNESYRFWPTISCYDNQLYIVGLLYKESRWEADGKNKITQKEGDMTKIQDLDELKDKSKLLLERLKGLVEIPTEELWNEWHKEDKK